MLFRVLHVFKREFSRFDQVGHDRLGFPAEHRQEIVDQASAGRFARDSRFEDMGGPTSLRARRKAFLASSRTTMVWTVV